MAVGRVKMPLTGCFRNDAGVSGPLVAPFPPPAHRTGRADFPHPALGARFSRLPLTCNAACSFWIHPELLGSSPISFSFATSCIDLTTQAPSLHRNYPASSVLRACPPSYPAADIERRSGRIKSKMKSKIMKRSKSKSRSKIRSPERPAAHRFTRDSLAAPTRPGPGSISPCGGTADRPTGSPGSGCFHRD